MATTSAGKMKKGLPKRCRNEALKNRRHASWLRGKERKEKRRKDNEERHRLNKLNGGPTAWERAEAKRAALREGRTPVQRTPHGNVIRPDGRVEACCNFRKRDRFGNRLECVHVRTARGGTT